MAVPVPPPQADVFPTQDAALADWADAFNAAWLPATFGVTTPTTIVLTAAITDYKAALATLMVNNNTSNRAAKNQLKAELIVQLRAACRAAKNAWREGTVSDAVLTSLNVRIPKLTPTPINPPVDAPILGINAVGPGKTRLRLTQVVDGEPVTLRRFPDGVALAEIEYKTPTGDWTPIESARRVNLSLATPSVSQGTVLSWRARYATARGLTGPYSATVQTVAMF